MAGPRPMLSDFDDPNVPAGHADGLLPGDAIHDQENAYGFGPWFTVKLVKLADWSFASRPPTGVNDGPPAPRQRC